MISVIKIQPMTFLSNIFSNMKKSGWLDQSRYKILIRNHTFYLWLLISLKGINSCKSIHVNLAVVCFISEQYVIFSKSQCSRNREMHIKIFSIISKNQIVCKYIYDIIFAKKSLTRKVIWLIF